MRAIILFCAMVLFGVGNARAQEESGDALGNIQPAAGIQAAETTSQPNAQASQPQPAPQPGQAEQAAPNTPAFGSNINKSFIDAIGPSGIKNIVEAEQVFCYEVTNKPANYQGYTINNLAVAGFCGVLNADLAEMLDGQLFETPSNFSFDTAENCVVNARILLRYVRGIDTTDIVLSAPCHSMIMYYGGNVKAFNMRPGAELVDAVTDAFSKNRVDFTSPALLNQVLPIGIPQTLEQQNLVESKRSSQPVRNWDQTGGEASTPGTAADPKKSGWNNLNL